MVERLVSRQTCATKVNLLRTTLKRLGNRSLKDWLVNHLSFQNLVACLSLTILKRLEANEN